ncbi:protein DEPP1 [Gastrophryne carolinensis]
MRSKLLISVEHLPTISEDREVTAQEKPAANTFRDNRMDDYIKSIQTLAQPCSLITDQNLSGQCRSQRRTRFRPRSSLKVCESRVLAVAPNSCHVNQDPIQACADPLAWLYRQSGKENQECEQIPTVPNFPKELRLANTTNLQKPTDTNKWLKNKFQSDEFQNAHEKRSRSQRLQKKWRPSVYGSRGSISKLHKPQLPVIYEL